MKAHLPFSEEEQAWRAEHFDLVVPEHHYARAETPSIIEAHRLAFAKPVHGFDVSSYQPAAPDFRQGGRGFAIFKATEGTGYFDRNFGANRAKSHAQGLPFIGLYHFARPASHSPEAEAQYFLAHVGSRQPGECAVLDYETSPWSVPWVVRWLQVVQAAGWPTEFYSYLGMLSANATDGIPQTGTGLWIAAYGCREPGNDRWAAKDLWQHTDGAANICGNDGGWDCSIGELDLLVARVGAAPGPTPPPTTEDDEMSATTTDLLPYGGGGQCTIDFDNLKGGAAGWNNAIVRIPWDFPGGPDTHKVRIVVWDQDDHVGTAGDLAEFVDLRKPGTLVIPVKREWKAMSITSQVTERDPRGDTNVRTVFWK